MPIPTWKHRPTQVAFAAIVGTAFLVPFWLLWRLVVRDSTAARFAAPSTVVFAVAIYWWYGNVQNKQSEK
jgi:hypothetical protein